MWKCIWRTKTKTEKEVNNKIIEHKQKKTKTRKTDAEEIKITIHTTPTYCQHIYGPKRSPQINS
jgi:predicted small metal-binding protein